jgi:hypothetical protein
MKKPPTSSLSRWAKPTTSAISPAKPCLKRIPGDLLTRVQNMKGTGVAAVDRHYAYGEFGVTDIIKLSDWSEKQILENPCARD